MEWVNGNMGSGTTMLTNVAVTNTGTVAVQTGTLQLSGGSGSFNNNGTIDQPMAQLVSDLKQRGMLDQANPGRHEQQRRRAKNARRQQQFMPLPDGRAAQRLERHRRRPLLRDHCQRPGGEARRRQRCRPIAHAADPGHDAQGRHLPREHRFGDRAADDDQREGSPHHDRCQITVVPRKMASVQAAITATMVATPRISARLRCGPAPGGCSQLFSIGLT